MTQVDQRFPATNESPRGAPGRARRGLTLVEVLVATVVLTGVLLIVSTVFTTASNTTGQVIANSELLADFNAMQERLRADLETIEPGMLSIYAPNTYNAHGAVPIDLPPIAMRNMPDVAPLRPSDQGLGSGGVPWRVARADMLSFVSGGTRHESNWLTVRMDVPGGIPIFEPLTMPDALITYGHGVPFVAPGGVVVSRLSNVQAFDWDFCRRAILLGAPPDGGPVDYADSPAPLPYRPLALDADLPARLNDLQNFIASGFLDVSTTTAKEIRDLVRVNYQRPSEFQGLFDRSKTHPGVIDSNFNDGYDPHYWRRHGTRFMSHVGTVIIEWTDGSLVDPRDADPDPNRYVPVNPAIQWFGRPRDVNGDGDLGDAYQGNDLTNAELNDPVDVMTQFQWANRFSTDFGTLPYAPFIELRPFVIDYMTNDRYVAVWTPDSWDRRPTAIRVTTRIYDPQQRIRNEELWPPAARHPDFVSSGGPYVRETRYGRELSFVVPVP